MLFYTQYNNEQNQNWQMPCQCKQQPVCYPQPDYNCPKMPCPCKKFGCPKRQKDEYVFVIEGKISVVQKRKCPFFNFG